MKGRLRLAIEPIPLTAVLLWGGVYPGAKLGLLEIPLASFASLRLVIAAAVLLGLAGGLGAIRLPRTIWAPMLIAGAAQTVFQTFFVLSMERTTAGSGAVLLATAPLLVAVWQSVARHEQIQPSAWLGLGLGFLGVGLVVSGGGVDVGGENLIGNLCALVSAAGWAWYGVSVGRVVQVVGSRVATGWAMAMAAAILLPFSLGELAHHPWSDVSWVGWSALIYGSIAGPVIAMSLWGRALLRLGPQRTMVYTYLEPVAAVILAASLLGESFSPAQLIGAVLAFAGVWLVSGAETPAAQRTLA